MFRPARWARHHKRLTFVAAGATAAVAATGLGLHGASAAYNSPLMVSTRADRSGAVDLEGARVGGPAFVFVRESGSFVEKVDFFLDDTSRVRTPLHSELADPFDLAGTADARLAKPYDLSKLSGSTHTVTVVVHWRDGTESNFSSRFTNTDGSSAPTTAPTGPPTSSPRPSSPRPTASATRTATATPTRTATATPTRTTTTAPTGSKTCTNPVFTTSDPNGGRDIGGYYIHNNMWNTAEAGPETVSACAADNWFVDSTQRNSTSVKTYPNVHKDINNLNGTRLNTFGTIRSSFASQAPDVGIYDVAYDVWLNGVGWGNGTTEFMVWTKNRNQRPLGTMDGTVTFGGKSYQAWHYRGDGANVISLVATSTMNSGTVDLKAMFDWGIMKGWMPSNPTVNQIGYGVEVCSTDNTRQRFTFTDFSVTTS